MGNKIYFSFLVLTLIMVVNACVPAVNLKMEQLTKGDMNSGSVVVGTVLNKRAEDYGGEGFDFIGTLRGGYGNPFDLKTEPGRDLETVFKEAAKTALEHTGYSTDPVAGKSLRLDIDLLDFWCDGYTEYKIDASIAVKLVNPANGDVLAQKKIDVQKGFALLWGYGQMHEEFDNTINDIQKELVVFIQSQEFRNAVKM
jgi:hypothetical protein